MLANAGYPVTSLTRIRFGGIQLGDMAPGELRALEPDELAWAENLMESTYNQQMVISRNQTLPATKEERRAARPKTESEKTAKDLFEFLRQEEENRPDDEELKKRMTPEQFAEHLRMRKAIEKFNDPETDIENDWDFEFSREQKRAMERFDEEMDADSSAVSSGSLGAPGLGVQGGVHRGSDSDLTETFPWLEDLAMSKEEIFREGGGKGAEEEGGQEEENRWEVMRREQQLRDRIFGRGGGGLGVNEEEDALLSEEEEETEGVDLLRQRERSRG
uniref:Uncharacterized protein n=1 Tax=Chromera velia CCMP2878 TaxID=1169474 RepID=A0A0G4HN41_9ALVE|eukprot:Cvel_7577.t1-p1 / transcript=Cvel_7577.t1 / gene=Cvel_7577 / organism=Chromera_velia_CCMP2878 / gene_product=hypothetical protein / transcript_product=hypothetical protein / location=Cvel_scaffold399:19393-20214(-) / protein_length=274 / sequence_SO=supercontig / SO=protein_coding / is_pseudo=false